MTFWDCSQIFTDLSAKVKPGELAVIENVLMLTDSLYVLYVLTMFGIMCGLLFGKKRLERDSSLASSFLSIVLLAFHLEFWWMYVISLAISVAGYVLYRLNQL